MGMKLNQFVCKLTHRVTAIRATPDPSVVNKRNAIAGAMPLVHPIQWRWFRWSGLFTKDLSKQLLQILGKAHPTASEMPARVSRQNTSAPRAMQSHFMSSLWDSAIGHDNAFIP